jgi:hypothetical protein
MKSEFENHAKNLFVFSLLNQILDFKTISKHLFSIFYNN